MFYPSRVERATLTQTSTINSIMRYRLGHSITRSLILLIGQHITRGKMGLLLQPNSCPSLVEGLHTVTQRNHQNTTHHCHTHMTFALPNTDTSNQKREGSTIEPRQF